ncbi:hypothetical protein BLNAU_20835 [Blattamonas nauphoetae]|uniref:Uncharacterized protein n=1 Tax=Blattamonas nauphoetae TaxID=2049346 RepID=A0ABQ9WXI6_9EUKA|nr:hypothetical protein BLNAU_20835 [Blattamonas nauphoetae]
MCWEFSWREEHSTQHHFFLTSPLSLSPPTSLSSTRSSPCLRSSQKQPLPLLPPSRYPPSPFHSSPHPTPILNHAPSSSSSPPSSSTQPLGSLALSPPLSLIDYFMGSHHTHSRFQSSTRSSAKAMI